MIKLLVICKPRSKDCKVLKTKLIKIYQNANKMLRPFKPLKQMLLEPKQEWQKLALPVWILAP